MKRLVFACIVTALMLAAGNLAQAQPGVAADYTRDLPSVQKVESEIRGADATDTTARQVAVFTYLQSYIQRIKLARDYRGAYTAGEQALLNDYSLAAYQLSQDFGKSHSPPEVKAFQQKEGQYEVSGALDWVQQLQGQQAADTYHGTEASLAKGYQAHQDQLQRQMKPDQGAGLAGDAVLDPTGMFARAEADRVNDPQLRRCLELDGTLDECEGLGGAAAMAGVLTPDGSKPDPGAPPPTAGIVLAGVYRGPAGEAGVALDTGFGRGQAIVLNCGSLADSGTDGRAYRLRKAGAGVQLVIDNDPQPIVVELRPDGMLAGPGPVRVKGLVITGYKTTTRQTMVNGAPAGQQGYNCNGPCATSTSEPIFGPKVERCVLGAMAPVRTLPAAPAQKTGIGFIDAISESRPLVTGWRATGQFANASGMKLEFANDAATLDCGRAHARMPYVVDNTPAGFTIRIQNPAGAFLLAVAPDGTLHAPGAATVAGRLVTAIRGDGVSYSPVSETCGLGAFDPRGERRTMGEP